MVFRPGYAPLPSRPQLFPPGVAAARFTEAGASARLAPVTDYEDRAEAFNTFVAMLNAAQLFPPTELPETSELLRFELESLGARPLKPANARWAMSGWLRVLALFGLLAIVRRFGGFVAGVSRMGPIS